MHNLMFLLYRKHKTVQWSNVLKESGYNSQYVRLINMQCECHITNSAEGNLCSAVLHLIALTKQFGCKKLPPIYKRLQKLCSILFSDCSSRNSSDFGRFTQVPFHNNTLFMLSQADEKSLSLTGIEWNKNKPGVFAKKIKYFQTAKVQINILKLLHSR